jgi:hypothetical protein
LQGLLGQMNPQGVELFHQILQVLREALSSALSHVFLFALFFVAIAFVVNFFIKEIPLRKQHTITRPPSV